MSDVPPPTPPSHPSAADAPPAAYRAPSVAQGDPSLLTGPVLRRRRRRAPRTIGSRWGCGVPLAIVVALAVAATVSLGTGWLKVARHGNPILDRTTTTLPLDTRTGHAPPVRLPSGASPARLRAAKESAMVGFCRTGGALPWQPAYRRGNPLQAVFLGPDADPRTSRPVELVHARPVSSRTDISAVTLAVCAGTRSTLPVDDSCSYDVPDGAEDVPLRLETFRVEVYEVRTGTLIGGSTLTAQDTGCPSSPGPEFGDAVVVRATSNDYRAWIQAHLMGGILH